MAAPAPRRPGAPSRMMSMMRPPPPRPGANRAQTATPTLTGRTSPIDSTASSKARTPKRNTTTDLDQGGEETNINVVVRCRGRNDREVRENSGVVVSTDGVKGKKVDLSMGPSALSNKTYSFDKVFSPAADQGIIFEEVVAPILDEVLAGFNCTIFAYGQTGTGKTYTMSGDITDTLPVPDAAGIIPRVLHTLFDKLGDDDSDKNENSVKCSFIELYNEEVRDLLATDDNAKLKIFDEANKNGRTTTLVQGMGESHIKDASKGIALLREGSHKRQVAATKCNDLSSRSHTVFTVTVYMKRTSDTGEDLVSAGKLNLVDLAGSENIQRSGAENKRAAEAGLINKSLLTLGRVINALVEKSSHIPYRESKLTRLLQDSLGGRTKTCIIATLSPAKSNLEETISTLDYAFRAKNIRNKAQVNQTVSKKTLLREFTAEIEKLKSELIAARQRNGVYLPAETYEEMTTESESRRILSEEQRDKLETMEHNLRNKVQELFALTMLFQSLKRDTEQTRVMLEGTNNVLEKTEIVLAHTKRGLAEEKQLRKAHQETEGKLSLVGEDLLSTLSTTTDHIDRLHSKLRRRSDLQSTNRSKWSESQMHITDATTAIEDHVEALQVQQQTVLSSLSGRMQSFITDELQGLQASQAILQEKTAAFQISEREVSAQTSKAKDEMNHVLEEIGTLRADVKEKVSAGLNDLSAAAQRIGEGIATELGAFHDQLQDSYVSLGREFKAIFEGTIKSMQEQQDEAARLRQLIMQANVDFVSAGQASHSQLQQAVTDERQIAAGERQDLLSKIAGLINDSATTQEARMSGYLNGATKRLKTSEDSYCASQQAYGAGMDSWTFSNQALIKSSIASREAIKSRLQTDWSQAHAQTTALITTTHAVHGEAVRIVDTQLSHMDGQLGALDEILTRVHAQNDEHHAAHTASLGRLAGDVQGSYQSIGQHFETSYQRTRTLDQEVDAHVRELTDTLPALGEEGDVRQCLRQLREEVMGARMQEYVPSGETPARTAYSYPTTLPRTESHETLLARLREGPAHDRPVSPEKRSPGKRGSPSKMLLGPRSSPMKAATASPSKTSVFTDTPSPPSFSLPLQATSALVARPQSASADPSLRELDANIPSSLANAASNTALPGLTALASSQKGSDAKHDSEHGDGILGDKVVAAKLKRQRTDPLGTLQGQGEFTMKVPLKRSARATVAGTAEGRENVPPVLVDLGASLGSRGGLRRLRARGSD